VLHDPRRTETRDVQARLGIVVLIVDHVQHPQASRDVKELQGIARQFKDVRVGMRRAKGGG
jgi:hypothetical protein